MAPDRIKEVQKYQTCESDVQPVYSFRLACDIRQFYLGSDGKQEN